MMTTVQRIAENERHFKAIGRSKTMFTWCIRCAGAEGCYTENMGPNFLDPDCYRGPMTENEREQARIALEND